MGQRILRRHHLFELYTAKNQFISSVIADSVGEAKVVFSIKHNGCYIMLDKTKNKSYSIKIGDLSKATDLYL